MTNRSNPRTNLMLLLVMAISGAGSAFEVPLAVKITGFYHITDRDFGLFLGLTTLMMAAASAPWGYVADRYRRVALLIAVYLFLYRQLEPNLERVKRILEERAQQIQNSAP